MTGLPEQENLEFKKVIFICYQQITVLSIIVRPILYVKGTSNILHLIEMITNTSRSETGSGSLKKLKWIRIWEIRGVPDLVHYQTLTTGRMLIKS
jgi:hypothetical protein